MEETKPAAQVWHSKLAGGITMNDLKDTELPKRIASSMTFKVKNRMSIESIPKCLPEPIDGLV